jgi:secreted trypsin-like serine protease
VPFCSGTLIRNNVVLTAGHCLKWSKVRSKFKKVAVYVGNNPAAEPAFIVNANMFLASQVRVHPSYNGAQILNDVALIRLASPVASVAPVPNLPLSLGLSSADNGINLNFAGFGNQEDGTYGIKEQVNRPLAHLGDENNANVNMYITYSQVGGVGPCNGDSGGPAFIYRSGRPYVAATTSYGDEACTQIGVSTRTDTYESFINSF